MSLAENSILEDRYRIESLIAQGGMGAVYRAFDSNLDIIVAVKENFLQSPENISQFQREARILARSRHSNLPRVIDHFYDQDHQYLVMDFIEGRDLWQIMQETQYPLAEEAALDYISQVCEAVSYLHQQQPPIIHRDIKPQNIKITPRGKAILVDFGIAKIAEGDGRTQAGAKGLTPGYSPPEQYSQAGTNPTSDIYSLGATLYALLTAKAPPDSISLTTGEVKFEPPETSNPMISPDLSRSIQHAMRLQVADRPQTVSSWQQELRAIQEDRVATQPDETASTASTEAPTKIGPPPTPMDIAGDYSRKGRSLWQWLGLAVIVLTILVGLSYLCRRQTKNLWVNNQLNDQAILAGTPVVLSWQASRFANVSIECLGVPNCPLTGDIEGPSGTALAQPTGDVVYVLKARNLLSEVPVIGSVLFQPTREAPPVYVTPVLPDIRVFMVNTDTIVTGEEITLHWEVSHADEVILRTNDAPEVLPTEAHIGQVSATLGTTTTYVLAARNRYGSDTQNVRIVVSSATPTITPSPSLIPSATPIGPEIPADSLLKNIAHPSAEIETLLGRHEDIKPLGNVAHQYFTEGLIIWWQNPDGEDRVWVIPNGGQADTGNKILRRKNTWQPGKDITPADCPEAQEPIPIKYSFGILWCYDRSVKDVLGLPLAEQFRSPDNAIVEIFENGTVISISNPVDEKIKILVLIEKGAARGTWQMFDQQ